MTILITGAGGFIGSHVAELLLSGGHKVRALVRYNSRRHCGHLEETDDDLRDALDVRFGDVTDPFLMKHLTEGCDVVLHLAALIGIPYSYVAPASYIETNVSGTLNVLEAARTCGVKRVVVTSTSEVYGTAKYTPIDEAHPLQGQSPYSATKIAADKLAESFYRSFDLSVVILRPFNTYGPRQSARAIIPTILVQLLSGSKKIELGNLTPQRDLTFVTDTARAFALAATVRGIEGETIHFGSGTAVSVAEIAAMCRNVVGSDAEVVSVAERTRPEKSEVGLLLADASKAVERLGWQVSVELKDGLSRTADYLEQHLGDYRAALSNYVV